jgi:hypothetical protein
MKMVWLAHWTWVPLAADILVLFFLTDHVGPPVAMDWVFVFITATACLLSLAMIWVLLNRRDSKLSGTIAGILAFSHAVYFLWFSLLAFYRQTLISIFGDIVTYLLLITPAVAAGIGVLALIRRRWEWSSLRTIYLLTYFHAVVMTGHHAWALFQSILHPRYFMGRPRRWHNRASRHQVSKIFGKGENDWGAIAHDEFVSVASFADLVSDLVEVDAPAHLIRRANRSADDELRHAEVTARFTRPNQKIGILKGANRKQSLARLERLAIESFLDGCLNEAIAAEHLMIRAHEENSEELNRVVADEKNHAVLAWDIFDWSLNRLLQEGAPQRRERILRAAIREVQSERGTDPVEVRVYAQCLERLKTAINSAL